MIEELSRAHAIEVAPQSVLCASIPRRVRKHDVSSPAIANLDPLHPATTVRPVKKPAHDADKLPPNLLTPLHRTNDDLKSVGGSLV